MPASLPSGLSSQPSLLPALSHPSPPVALITSPQTLLLLHRLSYFLLQTTITLFHSCSCSHISAFCFNHTTTPLPSSSVSPILSARAIFSETSVHFSRHPWFTFVKHTDFFATNFLHTLENSPVPPYHYSTRQFLPAFSTLCSTECQWNWQSHTSTENLQP